MSKRKTMPEDGFMAGAAEYWESKTGRNRDDYPKESLDDEGRRKRLERIWEGRRKASARKMETWSRRDLEAGIGQVPGSEEQE